MRRNAPKNSLNEFISRERKRKKTRPQTVLYCLLTWVPEIPQRLDSNEDVPHIQMFEQKYSEAPGGIFVLSARYKKGDCLLLHAIRRTIIVESYEVKLKSAVKIKHYRRKRSSEVSHRRKTAETQLRNGRIKERPVKTMEWFKKNERQPASTKLFIQMINFYV